jgi:hypothetical protein
MKKMEVAMKAVLMNGVIQPKEPIPQEWPNGVELEVDRADFSTNGTAAEEIDRWYEELEAACSQMDPADDRILKDAVLEVRRQEKELARKQAERE